MYIYIIIWFQIFSGHWKPPNFKGFLTNLMINACSAACWHGVEISPNCASSSEFACTETLTLVSGPIFCCVWQQLVCNSKTAAIRYTPLSRETSFPICIWSISYSTVQHVQSPTGLLPGMLPVPLWVSLGLCSSQQNMIKKRLVIPQFDDVPMASALNTSESLEIQKWLQSFKRPVVLWPRSLRLQGP